MWTGPFWVSESNLNQLQKTYCVIIIHYYLYKEADIEF